MTDNEIYKYPLDEDAIQMIAAADEQMRQINAQVVGMVTYVIRTKKLPDPQNWRIAENRKELVRPMPEPAPAQFHAESPRIEPAYVNGDAGNSLNS